MLVHPDALAGLRARVLAPLETVSAGSRDKLTATLRAWLCTTAGVKTWPKPGLWTARRSTTAWANCAISTATG